VVAAWLHVFNFSVRVLFLGTAMSIVKSFRAKDPSFISNFMCSVPNLDLTLTMYVVYSHSILSHDRV
jgi:hypothetical protein